MILSDRDGIPEVVGEPAWVLVYILDDDGTAFQYHEALVPDPCSNKPTPTTILFPYDRQAASRYAVVQSFVNNDPSIPLVFTTVPPIGGYVSSNRYAAPSTNPNWVGHPYYDFFNRGLTLTTGATGSSVYVSETIWIGGLPMTRDENNETNCDTVNSETTGWRYCSNSETTVIGWDEHASRIAYYTNSNFSLPYYGIRPNDQKHIDELVANNCNIPIHPVTHEAIVFKLFINNVINTTGEPLLRTSSSDANRWWFNSSDTNPFLPHISTGGDDGLHGDLTNPVHLDALDSFTANQLSNLAAGDVVWINAFQIIPNGCNKNGDNHSFFIAGWGEAEICTSVYTHSESRWDAFLASLGDNLEMFGLYTTRSKALNNNIDHPIPYIVDFPGIAIIGGQVQRPIPRPFFCTRSPDPLSNNVNSIVWSTNGFTRPHGWFFFTMPDSLKIDTSKLYTSIP